MTRAVGAGRVLGSGIAIMVGGAVPAWAHGITERVSVGARGVEGDADSRGPSLSADGRFVAFYSEATNLVPGDSNVERDVFVRDRRTGTTERVSVGPGGVQGDGASYPSGLSTDGRFVAFLSFASNLVPGDTNGAPDVFVRDRKAGKTDRVSVGLHGLQGDRDSFSYDQSISADGRFVAFYSEATNLVPGDTNECADAFVRDRLTGRTRRVNLGAGGIQGNEAVSTPAISADGRFVAFGSSATNLVPGDTNETSDVFVRDRKSGTTQRVSLGPAGVQGNSYSDNASLSANGRLVAFWSFATNLVPRDTNNTPDVFVRDRKTGKTQRVSLGRRNVQGNGSSGGGPISADGRFVAFTSEASNLVPGDTNLLRDVFLRDRKTGTTRRVSLGPAGVQGDGGSGGGPISANGRFVAFQSEATNLVPGDTNGTDDVFVRTLVP